MFFEQNILTCFYQTCSKIVVKKFHVIRFLPWTFFSFYFKFFFLFLYLSFRLCPNSSLSNWPWSFWFSRTIIVFKNILLLKQIMMFRMSRIPILPIDRCLANNIIWFLNSFIFQIPEMEDPNHRIRDLVQRRVVEFNKQAISTARCVKGPFKASTSQGGGEASASHPISFTKWSKIFYIYMYIEYLLETNIWNVGHYECMTGHIFVKWNNKLNSIFLDRLLFKSHQGWLSARRNWLRLPELLFDLSPTTGPSSASSTPTSSTIMLSSKNQEKDGKCETEKKENTQK